MPWKINVVSVYVDSCQVMQHAERMRLIAICGPSGSTIFLYILINGTIFGEKKIKCVLIFSAIFV
jgi:hypothetical protein